jgi:hypothetical protein
MAQTITVSISDAEEAALKYDLLDINDWVQKAVAGKINQCQKRLIKNWLPVVLADPAVETLQADEAAFVGYVLSRPDYMDRAARDAAAAAAAAE